MVRLCTDMDLPEAQEYSQALKRAEQVKERKASAVHTNNIQNQHFIAYRQPVEALDVHDRPERALVVPILRAKLIQRHVRQVLTPKVFLA